MVVILQKKMLEKKKKNAQKIIEVLEFGEEKARLMQQIRKRRSYKEFKDFYFRLKINKKSRAIILLQVWKFIDDYRGFKYKQNSDWAMESIIQVIQDYDRGVLK